MVSPRPTSLISGETSWLTETCAKPISRASAATCLLVLGIAVGVHEHDRDRLDAVGAARAASSARTASRSGALLDRAVGAHALVDLDDALVQHLGLDDVLGEDLRPRLVADAQRVAETLGGDQQRAVALALEQRVGGDRRAHLDRADAARRDRLALLQAEQVADALHGGVAIGSGFSESSLCAVQRAVRPPPDHVGEGAAAVDPEIPRCVVLDSAPPSLISRAVTPDDVVTQAADAARDIRVWINRQQFVDKLSTWHIVHAQTGDDGWTTTTRRLARAAIAARAATGELGPIVSSAHLATGLMPSLSELEFGLILLGHAFNRWIVRCAAAAGVRRPLGARSAGAAHRQSSRPAEAARRHLPRAQCRGHAPRHLCGEEAAGARAGRLRPPRQGKDGRDHSQRRGTVPASIARSARRCWSKPVRGTGVDERKLSEIGWHDACIVGALRSGRARGGKSIVSSAGRGAGAMIRKCLDGLYLCAGYARRRVSGRHLRDHDGACRSGGNSPQHPGRRRLRLLVHGGDGVPRPRAHLQARRDDPRRAAARKAARTQRSRSPRSLRSRVARGFILYFTATPCR